MVLHEFGVHPNHLHSSLKYQTRLSDGWPKQKLKTKMSSENWNSSQSNHSKLLWLCCKPASANQTNSHPVSAQQQQSGLGT
jgi:hypothetical protein